MGVEVRIRDMHLSALLHGVSFDSFLNKTHIVPPLTGGDVFIVQKVLVAAQVDSAGS